MRKRERLTGDLLVSISGILLFLAIHSWVDLNGYSNLAPVFLIAGVILLLWQDKVIKPPESLQKVSSTTIQTLSHILIFIGLEVYIYEHIQQYWIIFLVLGVILLNWGRNITRQIFRGS